MGNYNPHAAQDLGLEWVPIRQADYEPDEITERGYTFRIDNTVTPVSGSYNVAAVPSNIASFSRVAQFLALYPAGQEHLTGPIEQVVIPVSAVAITGTGTSVVGAANAVDALASPSDGAHINFSSIAQADCGLSFDTPSFAMYLNGKRILKVEILYQVASTPTNLAGASFSVQRAVGSSLATYALGLNGSLSLNTTTPVQAIDMGDLDPFWDSAVNDPYTTTEIYPWRFNELALFAATAGLTRLIGRFSIGAPDTTRNVQLGYVAMRVTYCEETRIRYGGDRKGALSGTIFTAGFAVGSALVRMRDTAFAQPSLAPGLYTLTSVYRDIAFDASPPPLLRAIQQLYEIPSIVGVNVTESTTVDTTFTKARTDVLPQLALHTTAGVVTGSHVYGTQIAAPVYGAATAIQDIHPDSAAGQSYPQVRFYARRFGDTTQPLNLRSVAATGTVVSISVSAFDALPEIIDGWREVTLRFPGPIPAFTSPTVQAWRWDTTETLAGNQWQVLGADGPSPTGTQSYAAATYFAPAGSTTELTWMSPAVTGTVVDPLSDAVLIFAQDPPTVTGFALSTTTQAVTGIALRCGSLPRCIPTGIAYNRVTWSAVSMPVTGFGQYELERFDSLDGEWQQIMVATSPAVTGFSDYEARVGVQSLYRVRACDALDFCGPWTSGAATIPAPGITPGGGAGVLIFTSNASQAGAYNLAHKMQWEGGAAQENFVFPEASAVAFQNMFGKDFPTAFHGTERGGEQFSRVLLIQGAAIPAESLANFRSLRDMAWASVPYITVRDELGNRWYAAVMVPGGNVRRNRQLYFAQVDIVEVTDTAAPVTITG